MLNHYGRNWKVPTGGDYTLCVHVDPPTFMRHDEVQDVSELLDRLLSRLSRCRLAPFIRLGKTIRKHREGILAARRLKLSNARAEALNNKAKLIVRRAYGFHSARAALALILLTCGPITLTLPHDRPVT